MYPAPLAPTVLARFGKLSFQSIDYMVCAEDGPRKSPCDLPQVDRLHLALGFGVKCAWAAGTPIVLEPVDESYRLGNRRRGRSREERKIRVFSWPDFLSNACGHLVVGVFLFLAGERSV
jgi:hypothetical protein